jgi:hypothetical protein
MNLNIIMFTLFYRPPVNGVVFLLFIQLSPRQKPFQVTMGRLVKKVRHQLYRLTTIAGIDESSMTKAGTRYSDVNDLVRRIISPLSGNRN